MLPASVAGFTRTRLARFTSDPRDVAAAYDFSSPQGGIAATIYIHPAARLASVGQSADAIAAARDEACRTLFRRRVRDMATAHLDAGEPRTRPVTFAKDGHAIPGRYATTLHTTELGGRTQPIRSELYLFCDVGRAWTIEFRFTHAEALDAAPRIAGLMNAIAWAVPD